MERPDATGTAVFLAGHSASVEIPIFEFTALAERLPANATFLRDSRFGWYQAGVRPLGNDIPSVAAAIRAWVPEAHRLVTVGVSAGGYAALAIGWLIGAHAVLAFSPQTELSVESLQGNSRTAQVRFKRLLDSGLVDPRFASIPDLVPPVDSRTSVYYGAERACDRDHAERIRGMPGVRLIPLATAEHNTALFLHRRGELLPVLVSSLCGP